MLYGMAESVREAVARMGYRVRVYSPVGELIPAMAYLIRRLLENTSNESFLRKSFVEKVPFEELILPPNPISISPEGPSTKDRPEGVEKSEEAPSSLVSLRDIEASTIKAFKNEPPIDFSKNENRERMMNSLIKIKTGFNKRYPLWIGDEKVWTDKVILSTNPANREEVVGQVSSATVKEADRAVEEARRGWVEWRRTPPVERASYLFRVAERMRRERSDLAALEVFEVGKSWKEADRDVAEAIDYLHYYGLEMLRLSPILLGDYPGEVNEYRYEPRGVGIVISPWNFPLAIPTGMISASIVTGNCAILKPSGLSPVIAWRLCELFNTTGLPSGVLQYLPGPGAEVGEYLVTHQGIDFIVFTGSREVGLKIVELAARVHQGQRNIKRVIAEMGGKNAIIIDDTADLDEAVKGAIESAFGYQGQKCSACSRIIVHEEIFQDFTERFKEAATSIKIGPPERPGTFMGPVIDERSLKKIEEYIAIGKREGSPLLIRSVSGEGYYVGPAIFLDIPPENRLAQEEIFGPLVTIFKARDLDEALRIANSTPYALTGGIYSRSPINIMKTKSEFRVGNLYINRPITGALVGRQPFGGFGMSGVGSKAGGPDYLLQFMNPVCVSENTMRKGFTPK